jgi:hypothetical protein
MFICNEANKVEMEWNSYTVRTQNLEFILAANRFLWHLDNRKYHVPFGVSPKVAKVPTRRVTSVAYVSSIACNRDVSNSLRMETNTLDIKIRRR